MTNKKTITLPLEIDVVVFDVDNTIVKGTTVFHAIKSLETIPKSEKRKLLRLAAHNIVYTLFSFENGLDFAKNEGLGLIKNYPSDFFKKSLQKNLERKIDKKTYEKLVHDIQEYKKQGKIIVLASAAPDFLVEVIANKVNADSYIGTVLEEKNGVFTGNILGEVNHGEIKARNIKNFLQQNNITREQVACFTDSIKDIKLLELAGKPVATNPDLILRLTAKKKNWDIIDLSPRLKITKIGAGLVVTGLSYIIVRKIKKTTS